MSTATLQPDEPTIASTERLPHQASSWRLWLAPRPFTLISSVIYLVVLFTIVDELGARVWPWRAPLIAGTLLLLMVIDRWDFWRWGAKPPPTIAAALLLIRLVLIEVIALLGDPWYGTSLHLLLVYLASFYFGVRGIVIVAAVAWFIFGGRSWLVLPLFQAGTAYATINDLTWVAILLLFVGTIAKVRVEEQTSRERAEYLLAELRQAHEQLKISANHALRIVRERHRLAREIHEQLGHSLAAINVQLEKVLAFRSMDPIVAEQAVRDAKRLGSAALQEVRRSVGALRVSEQIPTAPAHGVSDEPTPMQPEQKRGLRVWLLPRTFDLAPTVTYVAIYIELLSWDGQIWRWETFAFLGVLLLLLLIDRVDYWVWRGAPSRKVATALLVLRFVLFGCIAAIQGTWYLLWLMPLVPYYGYLYYGNRAGVGFSGVVWTLLLIMAILGFRSEGAAADAGNFVAGFFFVSLLLLLVVTTSKSVLKERAHRSEAEGVLADLRGAHEQLTGYARQALAAIHERNHLAREIHDGLGHYLTVINVQLEKALAFRDIDPHAADQAVQDAKLLTAEALQDVRATWRALGAVQDGFVLGPAVNRLVNNMRHNLTIDVHVEGSEEHLSQQSLLVLYRVIQEGLTNVQKHAQARIVQIHLVFAEDEARVVLRDNGRGFDLDRESRPSGNGGCYGLRGVRERLELIGGRLDVQSSRDAGTELRIVVPKDQLGLSPRPAVQMQGAMQ